MNILSLVLIELKGWNEHPKFQSVKGRCKYLYRKCGSNR